MAEPAPDTSWAKTVEIKDYGKQPAASVTLEGPAYCCPVCLAEGDWYLLRHGDAVVSWACDDDLPSVLRAMQRDFERTEVTVTEVKR